MHSHFTVLYSIPVPHCNYVFLDVFACQLTSQIQPSNTVCFNTLSLSLLAHHWTFSRYSTVIWMSTIPVRANMGLSALGLNLAGTARRNVYNRKHKSRLLQVTYTLLYWHSDARVHSCYCMLFEISNRRMD